VVPRRRPASTAAREERGQLLDGEAPGDDGRGPERHLGVRDGEQHASSERLDQVVGEGGRVLDVDDTVPDDEPGLFGESGEELDGEERVSRRLRQPRRQVGAGHRTPPGSDQRGHRLGRQGRQLDPDRGAGRRLLHPTQLVGEGMRPCRGHEQHAECRGSACDCGQQVEARVVGPVGVVGQQCHQVGGRHSFEKGECDPDRIRAGVRRQLGEQATGHRPRPMAGGLVGSGGPHPDSVVSEMFRRGVEQAGLARAGLADDLHEPAHSLDERLRSACQQCQLPRPPDEVRHHHRRG
jgi:hypothetical protein